MEGPDDSTVYLDITSVKSGYGLDGEADVEDVALADDVLLALHPNEALRLRGVHRPGRDEVVVADHLGADEPAFQVRVDHAGGFGRLGAAPDLPGPRLILPRREERDEVEGAVSRPDDLVETRLVNAELVEQYSRRAGEQQAGKA